MNPDLLTQIASFFSSHLGPNWLMIVLGGIYLMLPANSPIKAFLNKLIGGIVPAPGPGPTPGPTPLVPVVPVPGPTPGPGPLPLVTTIAQLIALVQQLHLLGRHDEAEKVTQTIGFLAAPAPAATTTVAK
jgi:hypothetical protein